MFDFLARLKEILKRPRNYCLRCRQLQIVVSVRYVPVNDRRTRQGRCAECGSKTSAFVTT